MIEAIDGCVNPKAQVPMAAGYDDGGEWASEYESFMTLLSEQTGIYSTQRVALQAARGTVTNALTGVIATKDNLQTQYTNIETKFGLATEGYNGLESRANMQTTIIDALKSPDAEGFTIPVPNADDDTLEGRCYKGIILDDVKNKAATYGQEMAKNMPILVGVNNEEAAAQYEELSSRTRDLLGEIQTGYKAAVLDEQAYKLLGTVIENLLTQYGLSDDGHDDNQMAMLSNQGLGASGGNTKGFFGNSNGSLGYQRAVPLDETRNGNGPETVLIRPEEIDEKPKETRLRRFLNWFRT